MTWLQKSIIFVYATVSFFAFLKGFLESTRKNNSFHETPYLSWLGIFVWGDAIVFGPFWLLSSLASLLMKNWLFFLLIISVFWAVRGLGETIYWFNQQFSPINRNPPERLRGYRFLKNDSIWFIYQIFFQITTVIAIIGSLYFSHLWLKSLN